jgi:hypothetical protein
MQNVEMPLELEIRLKKTKNQKRKFIPKVTQAGRKRKKHSSRLTT